MCYSGNIFCLYKQICSYNFYSPSFRQIIAFHKLFCSLLSSLGKNHSIILHEVFPPTLKFEAYAIHKCTIIVFVQWMKYLWLFTLAFQLTSRQKRCETNLLIGPRKSVSCSHWGHLLPGARLGEERVYSVSSSKLAASGMAQFSPSYILLFLPIHKVIKLIKMVCWSSPKLEWNLLTWITNFFLPTEQ